MDIQSLTLLVEIIDCGNLSQVARKFNMTRANVSYHLAQLEKSVGAQLVRRTTRRVEATELGLRLYEHGRNIQNEILAARETVTRLGQGLQGRVGISVPSGYGDLVMTEWLIEFKNLYPGIVLDVLFENRTDHLRDEVDLSIRVMTDPPQSLVARHLGDVRCIACASREYAEAHGIPRTPQELREAPIISVGALGRQLRMFADDGATRHEVVLEPTLISDHLPFLRKGILAGLGVGLVPDYAMPDKLASGEVVAALQDYHLNIYGTHMYMLYMPSRHQTKAMRTCIDFLLEKARAAQPGDQRDALTSRAGTAPTITGGA